MYKEDKMPYVGNPERTREAFSSPFSDVEKNIMASKFISSKENPEAVLLFNLNIYGDVR